MNLSDLPGAPPLEGVALRGARVWRAGAGPGLAPPEVPEAVAVETPVALEFNGVSHAVMLATPADLEDFALGFALTEGIVDTAAQVHDLEVQEGARGITVRVGIASSCFARLKDRRRQLSGRSGCGLCGVESLDAVMATPCAVTPPVARFAPQAVLAAMSALRERQPLMARTGATHAAAWADAQGAVRCVREDIGRHNALDKLIGALMRAPGAAAARDGFALVTSRASFELVHKTATAGIGLLAAISGPTSLAVDRARDCGLSLAGYARGEGMAVYHDAGHIDWIRAA